MEEQLSCQLGPIKTIFCWVVLYVYKSSSWKIMPILPAVSYRLNILSSRQVFSDLEKKIDVPNVHLNYEGKTAQQLM